LYLNCRNCGDVVDPARAELGYDYCLKDECQERCLKRVELAAVGVNKAADYYSTADELLPPRLPRSTQAAEDDPPATESQPRRRAPARDKTPPSTLDRLRRLEAKLDRELARKYERFQRGELTARELDRERDDLVAEFNRQVMGENIRYRSMLRPRPFRGR
jgi:hypothetical protein